MSGKPGQFKDFNKTAKDLLTKVFPSKTGVHTWGLEFELKPKAGTTFTSKITNVAGVSTGETSAEVDLKDFGVVFKGLFKTDKPTLELSWKVDDKIPVVGLSAKVHFDASADAQTAGVSIGYVHNYANVNARVFVPVAYQILDFTKSEKITKQDTRLEADAVVHIPNQPIVLGASGKFSFPQTGDKRVDEAQVSLGYRDTKAFSPSITYVQKAVEFNPDSRAVSVAITSQPADTTYVAQVDYVLGGKGVVATLGYEYPLEDGARIKAKLNTDKQAGLSYSSKIGHSATLDFGTLLQLDTEKNLAVNSAFSFGLKFTQ